MRGAYQPIRARNDALANRHSLDTEGILVLLNIAGDPRRWHCDAPGDCLLSRYPARQRGPLGRTVQLLPNEGLIIAVR